MIHFVRALLLASVLAAPVMADYAPTHFLELAGCADVIVTGQIVEVQQDTFALKVDDLIVGTRRVGDIISVAKFWDWACAGRWEPYATGQHVLLFLKAKNDDETEPLRIMGAGDEGESLIVDGEAYTGFDIPGRRVKTDSRWRSEATAVSLDKLRAAIQDFRNAYHVVPAKQKWQKINGNSKYFPIERIDVLVWEPSNEEFKVRLPPGRKTPVVLFEKKSMLHLYLVQCVAKEQERIDELRALQLSTGG